MQKVRVEAQNGSYDILIGKNLLPPQIAQDYNSYAVITDQNVNEQYGHIFPGKGIEARGRGVCIIDPGEYSKTLKTLETVYEEMLLMGIDRKGAVFAFGGGVVGDLAGFAAATYMRGIDYVQVPTTLLAMVDSSVGGKVAVNIASGKNMAGAFYQPKQVIIDTGTLATLDKRQYAAGMAEVIKYAFIADGVLYKTLQDGHFKIEDIIERCVRIKAGYVQKDPFDKGERMQLNYGHTIGHAIEKEAGYGKLLHGEAVAIGMVLAARLGEALGISPNGLEAETVNILQKYGLPSSAPKEVLDAALLKLGHDKKAENGEVNFVLIDKIGHAIVQKLSPDTIRNTLTAGGSL
ncbi:MAG: 3-dehydroquinate synthase [Christensenellaceae bacterium]|jgi:3-dehydroquinate synthase